MSMGLPAVRGGLVALVAVSAAASTQARTASPPAPAGSPEASALFPKIAGWKISDGPTTYTPETLFEYIDGGAESFLQFDFQELASATYVNAGAGRAEDRKSPHAPNAGDSTASAKTEVTVDIYRHRDAIRAFGMYTQERPAGTTPLPIGSEAYAGPDYLQLVVGSYYVKLVQLGSKQPSVLRRFAEKVAASLPGTREIPAVLQCFPERGKRTRAEKFMARDFLGHPFLHDAVAVPYQIGAVNFRLFIVEGKDSAEVSAMVKRYRAVAKSPDPGADSAAAEGSATVKDPLNGEVLLQWKGRRMWGAVDQPGPEAKALVDELDRRLSILDK